MYCWTDIRRASRQRNECDSNSWPSAQQTYYIPCDDYAWCRCICIKLCEQSFDRSYLLRNSLRLYRVFARYALYHSINLNVIFLDLNIFLCMRHCKFCLLCLRIYVTSSCNLVVEYRFIIRLPSWPCPPVLYLARLTRERQ